MIPLRHVASIKWDFQMAKVLRDLRGKTPRRAIAEKIDGCSASYIEKLETIGMNETRGVSVDIVQAILAELGSDLDSLIFTISVKIP